MITIPEQTSKKWAPVVGSDVFGNIFQTKNITFDKRGYLGLSGSSRAVMNEAIDADFDEPAVILRSEDYGYFVETHDSAFEVSATQILGVRPTQIVTAGVPSGDTQSDACFASGLMVVTQDNDVDYYDPAANTWTDTNIALTATSQSQHPCEPFLSAGGVAIANVNTVLLYASPLTATPTLLVTLTILSDFYVTSLCYFNQNLYIGTMNRFGGKAALYVWNGYGPAAQQVFEVDSNIIYDVAVHNDSVVLFTGAGQLLRFNGAGFTELGAIPSFYIRRSLADETNINMYHNCLKSRGNLVYINISDRENNTILLNQPEGIWCYDSALDIFYHRYSLSNAMTVIDTVATASVNIATNQITVAAAPVSGTEVLYDAGGGTSIPELMDDKKYYIIKIDATTISLATTRALALAGTAIDLTGTGNNAQKLVSFPNTDFGQFRIGRCEALCMIERIIDLPQYGSDVIWGSTVFERNNSSSAGYLGSISPVVESRGYFITPKIFSTNIEDTFNQVILKFSPLVSDIDKIIIKYRTVDDRRDTIDAITGRWRATWTSTTTFTTTEVEFASAVKGDEIEFLRGAASGMLAHITAISVNAGTYTVTLDESFADYVTGDASIVVFRNWKKWQTISYGDKHDEKGYLALQLGAKSKMIQFKVELRGVGILIEELMVDNLYKLPSSVSRGGIIQ